MEIIEKFSGKRPRGWFGPGLTQTFDTLDYLSAAGIEYIGDWVLDDEPVTLQDDAQAGGGAALQFRAARHRHDGAAAPSLRRDVSARPWNTSSGCTRNRAERAEDHGDRHASLSFGRAASHRSRRAASLRRSSAGLASRAGTARRFSTGIARNARDLDPMALSGPRPKWLTFDCYGTLIQWDEGLIEAVARILRRHGAAGINPQAVMHAYDGHEHKLEQTPPHRSFREVAGESLRLALDEFGLPSDAIDLALLTGGISHMPPFPEVVGALAALKQAGFGLCIISNTDDDIIAGNVAQLVNHRSGGHCPAGSILQAVAAHLRACAPRARRPRRGDRSYLRQSAARPRCGPRHRVSLCLGRSWHRARVTARLSAGRDRADTRSGAGLVQEPRVEVAARLLTRSSSGNSRIQASVIASAAIPPISTEGTAPIAAATAPARKSPSVPDVPVHIELTADTRPSISWGCASAPATGGSPR